MTGSPVYSFMFVMRPFMAYLAQNNEMSRIITVKYIPRSMDGMQLQVFKMLSACRARKVGLLGQCPLEIVHLRHMDGIQADMEQETGQDQPEDS